MEMRSMSQQLPAAIAAAALLFASTGTTVLAQQVLEEKKKTTVETTGQVSESSSKKYEAESPKVEGSGEQNNWLIYGGAAALGVGAIALAAGGSSGSSGSSCDLEPVGPSVAGKDWAGTLDLNANGMQQVTAKVTQCGDQILINTTSSLAYGRTFEGTISSSGYMNVFDHITHETWTTYKGNASSTQIRIYDLVTGGTHLDSLIITRTLSN